MLRLVTLSFSYLMASAMARVSEWVGKVYCSNLEGLGLPPLETAIAGNKVIGYTEEGGKEYWKEPEGPLSEWEI